MHTVHTANTKPDQTDQTRHIMIINRIQQFIVGSVFMGASVALINTVYPNIAEDVMITTQSKVVGAIKMATIRMGWVFSFIFVIIRYVPVTPLISLLLFTLLYIWITREKTMVPFDKDVVMVSVEGVHQEEDNWTFVNHEQDNGWQLI